MPTPTPTDHTTPLPTPQTVHHSQTSRICTAVSRTVPQYIDPCDALPAAWPHDPRQSREYGTQDGLHTTFTWHTRSYTGPKAAQQDAIRSKSYCSDLSTSTAISPQHVVGSSKSQKDKLQDTTNLTPPMSSRTCPTTVPKASSPIAEPPLKSTGKTKSTPKLSVTTKASGWASGMRKKKRYSEMFNMNFSFSTASRRSAADRTPEISPRSSFSLPSFSSTPPTEDSLKRRQVHASGIDAFSTCPLKSPTSDCSALADHSCSSSSLPSQERTDASQARSTPSPPRPSFSAVEAHPGQLVDFSTSPSKNRPSADNRFCYNYSNAPSRPKSYPTREQATRHLNKGFAILDSSHTMEPGVSDISYRSPRRKRACTDERSMPSLSFSSLPSTPASTDTCPATPGAIPRQQALEPLRRTISDPSAEAFLRHIRASLEARKDAAAIKSRTYSVFADEAERGFLGDEPL